MLETDMCSGAKHLAPRTGGSCPCGMVTRIPAARRPPADPSPGVLALLAQCLDEGAGLRDASAPSLLRERADRLLAAFTAAGLVISAGAVDRLSA